MSLDKKNTLYKALQEDGHKGRTWFLKEALSKENTKDAFSMYKRSPGIIFEGLKFLTLGIAMVFGSFIIPLIHIVINLYNAYWAYTRYNENEKECNND